MNRLLAVDLDGTLITAQGTGAAEARDAFQPLLRSGVRICIATGRMAGSAAKLLPEMGVAEGHIIALNGAEIWHYPLRPRPLRRHAIAARTALSVLHRCMAAGAEVQGYVQGELRILAHTQKSRRYAERTRVTPRLVSERTLTDRPQKLLALIEPLRRDELMQELNQAFAGSIEAYGSEPDFIEIVPPGVNKGDALTWLARRLRIGMSSVYAAGDAENDLAMLRAAGHAFAPLGAVPDVQQAADKLLPAPPLLVAALAREVLS